MRQGSITRTTLFRSACAAVLAGAAVFIAPTFVQRAYANDVTCTATCRIGSCQGNAEYCVCSCHWFWGTPICNCVAPVRPAPEG